MKRFSLLLLATLVAGCASTPTTPGRTTGTIQRLDGTRIEADDLTARIDQLTKRANVHGLAVSIFNDGEIAYLETFGVKNTETGEPLRTDTVFYGASLSKAVFPVLVMQLVEEGVIDLDTPLVRYMDRPVHAYEARVWHEDQTDLEDDELHKKITARMCLSHTTGFPNWRSEEEGLRIHFEPGTRYSYSGEGFVFLQVAIERLTKRPLEDWMQERVFAPYGMKTSSYAWQPRFDENYCHGHDESGKVFKKDKDNAPRSGSTLETTPEDYARFVRAVLKGQGLEESSWNEMFSQIRIRSKQQFGPYEETAENDDIELGYGLGWGVFRTPHGRAAFKEGHGDGFEHYSIIFPDKGMGVVIMTNSANGESIYEELLELTIANTYSPLEWNGYVPYDR